MTASNWEEVALAARTEEPAWSLATRVAFRFCFAFLLLYNFPFPLDLIPSIGGPLSRVWQVLVQLVAQPLFGVEVTAVSNGSGDRTWNYIQLFLCTAIAVAATLLWSILDRRAESYPRLHRWLRAYVRFALAYAMIVYGMIKVIPSQFPAPPLDRLVQPFGDASPMGLLWTFMGASVGYTIFTGLGELAGGLLLTMRRTTLAGALISAAVMLHVTVLNFCYEVPVKLYASMLLFQALFLIAPDAKRLGAFFLAAPPPGRRWVAALGTGVVLTFLAYSVKEAVDVRKTLGALAARSPLYGIWNVDEITVDGKVQPPLLSEVTRWRRMVFDGPRMMSIQLVSDQRNRYLIELDEAKKTFVLKRRNDPAFQAAPFTYERPAPGTLIVAGTMEGKSIRATMHREEKQFLLNTRGFHWIHEAPFNR